MEAPKCKICGQRHWSADPCKIIGVIARPDEVWFIGASSAEGDVPFPAELPAPPKFDRVAYQREYMRKRRAAQKD